MLKRECVAMILAGGQGSRLGALTKNLAKPAVPYGGKYRIIDFPLSNCANSGIDVVGILTQYQPLVLNSYIGTGSSWDLSHLDGGAAILPPYQKKKASSWYSGTANAIYQNISFIDTYDPEYVVILSGDHIYKMDYDKMVQFHKEHEADATISVIRVPWEEASRFGIMNTDESFRIKSFEEKPKKPKSNLASMGVYVFSWQTLRRYLIEDANDPSSANDFGKNIIPKMLHEQEVMMAYPFEGYWRDVGTIESLWEANMDLLEEEPELDLYDDHWRIFSNTPQLPPQMIAPTAEVHNAIVSEGCQVNGTLKHSILFNGCYVGSGAVIQDSVIMPNVKIGTGVQIYNAIVGEGSIISDGCVVGSPREDKEGTPEITVVGERIMLPKNAKVEKNAIVDLDDRSQDSPISYHVS